MVGVCCSRKIPDVKENWCSVKKTYSNLSSCAVCGYIILESWGRNCCKNSLYRFSFSVSTRPEENPFCTAAWACEDNWRLCLKKRSAESPEHPSGGVKLSLWGCKTFTCPPAAACATDGPVAAHGGMMLWTQLLSKGPSLLLKVQKGHPACFRGWRLLLFL